MNFAVVQDVDNPTLKATRARLQAHLDDEECASCHKLLDNMLLVAHSDVSYAKNHDVSGIPVMLAGRAGGKIKPGLHIRGAGQPISRVGLTVQQLMGVPTDSWGQGAMRASRPIAEFLT